jgi:hypothetical protein
MADTLDEAKAAFGRWERQCPLSEGRSGRGLDAGRPDHLAPFLGFIGDELTEVGGIHWHWNAAQVGKPRRRVQQ